MTKHKERRILKNLHTMRLHIKTTPSTSIVPFDHLPVIVGTVHKWLGEHNDLHGKLSLYSFSWLKGGTRKDSGLEFRNGATFFISFFDDDYAKKTVKSILEQPSINWGMTVEDVVIEENPDEINEEYFFAASPILIKRQLNGSIKHLIYSDAEAGSLLEETLKHKMEIAGLEDHSLKITFDTSYQRATTKLVRYKGVENRASMCPVKITARPETKVFAWLVGLGNSTGIGFGAIN